MKNTNLHTSQTRIFLRAVKSKVFCSVQIIEQTQFQYSSVHDLHCTGGMAHLESAPPSKLGAWQPLLSVWPINYTTPVVPAAQCTLGVFLMNLKLVHGSCTTDEGYCMVVETFGSP